MYYETTTGYIVITWADKPISFIIDNPVLIFATLATILLLCLSPKR